MGILSGKDVFSSKFITAVITDSSSMMHFVPIKHTLGDHYVVEIDHKVYVFKVDGTRIKTWQKTLAKSFRVLFYDTNHYMPIAASDCTELYNILRKNDLPRVTGNMQKIFRILGSREKKALVNGEFKPHDLPTLMAEASELVGESTDRNLEARNFIQFLKNLDIDKIVTPVRHIGEFIEDDLKATNPAFLGEIVSHYQRTDTEHKIVSNKPVGVTKPYLKMLLVVMMIGIVIGVAYWAYDSGFFDNIGGIVPSFGPPGAPTADQLMAKYPTPEDLKAAVDSGEVDYDTLPREIQRMVDTVE